MWIHKPICCHLPIVCLLMTINIGRKEKNLADFYHDLYIVMYRMDIVILYLLIKSLFVIYNLSQNNA